MNARGAYQETYGPAGNGRTCEWKGADGVAHSADSSSCALPTAWFLPSIALQPTSSNIALSDKGLGQLGTASLYLLEIRPALAFPFTVSGMPASYGVQTIGLDPNTMLPASLKHQLFPGPNPLSPVAVEVEYSQYAKENGVQIPHSIVRRLNGAVDLAFTVATVTVGPSSVPQ
jgi:hypothetical protein